MGIAIDFLLDRALFDKFNKHCPDQEIEEWITQKIEELGSHNGMEPVYLPAHTKTQLKTFCEEHAEKEETTLPNDTWLAGPAMVFF